LRGVLFQLKPVLENGLKKFFQYQSLEELFLL
jgi:hypothetical protein